MMVEKEQIVENKSLEGETMIVEEQEDTLPDVETFELDGEKILVEEFPYFWTYNLLVNYRVKNSYTTDYFEARKTLKQGGVLDISVSDIYDHDQTFDDDIFYYGEGTEIQDAGECLDEIIDQFVAIERWIISQGWRKDRNVAFGTVLFYKDEDIEEDIHEKQLSE